LKRGLVSIVIPLFNGQSYIVKTLQSVVDQNYKNWECIVVNDGSSDGSRAVVEKFIAHRKELAIRLISISNSGVSIARNTGISNSRGEFIALLDNDDIWAPEKLMKQVDFLENNLDFGGVLCNFRISRTVSGSDTKTIRIIRNQNLNRLSRDWLTLEGNGAFPTSTMLFRSFEPSRGVLFDKSFSHVADLDFFLSFEKLARVGNIDMALVEYRQHQNQMHMNPKNLTKEYPHLLLKLGSEIPASLRRRCMANVLVMSALLNLHARAFQSANSDLKAAARIRLFSLISLPFYVFRKRVNGYVNKFFAN